MAGVLSLIRELAHYERSADQVQASEADVAELLFGSSTPSGRPAAYCHVIDDPLTGTHGNEPQLAAMALWYLSASTWTGRHGIYLEDLYVRPAHRGRGYGLALMAELAHICQVRGYRRLEWWVLDWNEPAIGFYRALGAEPMAQWTVQRISGNQLTGLARLRRSEERRSGPAEQFEPFAPDSRPAGPAIG